MELLGVLTMKVTNTVLVLLSEFCAPAPKVVCSNPNP